MMPWRILLSALSCTLWIALDDTIPTCWSIHSRVCFQDALKYTPSMLPITTSSMLSMTLPVIFSRMFPIAPCTWLHTPHRVLATGQGNPPAVRVWTGSTVWFGSRTVQKPDPQLLGWAKPVPVPVNPRVLPFGLARPVGSNLRFSFSRISIYGRVLISYCYVQTISFGTSLSLLVLLAAIIIKISTEMLPATSWIWVWTIFCFASLVRFEV